MRRIPALVTVLACFWTAQDVLLACGDKFFLMGGVDSYARVYAAVYPGTVLIYTGGSTSKGLGNPRLARHVSNAGHKVLVAASVLELEKALKTVAVDIVVADLEPAISLVAHVEAVSSRPTLVPVEGESRKRASPAQHRFAAKIKASNINQFLAQLDDVMEGRNAGARQQARR